MNGVDPGKFLTSTVTGGAGTIAGGIGKGALSGGFEGALLGASIGSIIPGAGTLAGGAIGAGLGASFGVLTGTSKALSKVWDKLIGVTRSLISTFAKFDPLITAQQERWKQLDMQMSKVWAKTLAPTLKHITDIGLEIKERWTRIKVSVFKSWEGVINKLIGALGTLVRVALSVSEFFTKLTSLVGDLIKLAFSPLVAIIKLLWAGIKELLEGLGFMRPKRGDLSTGMPKWAPGATPILSSTGGGARGGTPLLRGKFVPGGMMPAWAKEKKMEFGWVKDLKSWLGGYLDKILGALSVSKVFEAVTAELPTSPVTPSVIGPVGTTLLQFQRLGRARKRGRERRQRETEEGEPTSSLGPPVLPGVPGMIQGALSMSALTSVAPEPKIRMEGKPQEKLNGEETEETTPGEPVKTRGYASEARGNITMQVLDSNQLLDMLSFSWEEIRTVLRQQQAEYTLLKYRMQTEGTYL